MNISIRKATIDDSHFLQILEKSAFQIFQQSSALSIARSIQSNRQSVYIAEHNVKPLAVVGCYILIKYKKTARIFSISVAPSFQKQGIGVMLLQHALTLAKDARFEKVTLEVDAANKVIVDWYVSKGFSLVAELPDYYEAGKAALKMEYVFNEAKSRGKTRNIIVINQPEKWEFQNLNAEVISVKEYINNAVYHSNADLRIFNLCTSYKYQSYGYYVSLLASARGQRVVPSSTTLQDFQSIPIIRSVTNEIETLIASSLQKIPGSSLILHSYFGQTYQRGFSALAMKLYQLFEAPLLRIEFIKHDAWLIKEIKVLSLSKLPKEELPYVYSFAKKYFDKKRFTKSRLPNYKYDLAILVNPSEKTPPSCAKALQRFKHAANKKGMYCEFITKADFNKINEFDALFIRETTSVSDYTYEFSRLAYAEGLVVIDDPWSIMKCSNKIFQNETFKKHKVLTPQTKVLTKNVTSNQILESLNYPVVLKQPDSAFSMGVTKAENKAEAALALKALFKKSDMIISQEFLYSDFDWRIGIIDNTPIFACKYYMSQGHWQIYNWNTENNELEGNAETIAIENVPEIVVKTALKAARLIGDGLYGVDLKMIDGKVYVIEVNDNPNIDADVEDVVLKEKLYDTIISSIYSKIEAYKNVSRLVQEP